MSKKRTLLGCVFLLITLLLACPAKTVEPAPIRYTTDTPSEYEMKAIYLYNFLKFVKWPTDPCNLLGGKSRHIAVLGDTPFKHVLEDMQEKLKEKGKDLRLSFYGPYRGEMKLSCCCLLFIADSERNNLSSILDQLTGQPVLTVADGDTFMEQGVMITLFSQKNKIRWGINRQPVNASGFKISAKLLEIAVKVIDE